MQVHPIFQPFSLGGYSLTNRAVVAPMTRVQAAADGVPIPAMTAYYEAYAQGGFGMIITEGIYTDLVSSQGYLNQPGLATPEQARAWQAITSATTSRGSVIIAQLMHAGALSQYSASTLAPSAIQPAGYKMTGFGGSGRFSVPVAMDEKDIEKVKNGFVDASAQAYRAGFNGVELHAANGYLLDQFLTPHLNLRSDSYGGNAANRFRIVAEIIDEIRRVVPDDFLVGLRLSEGKVNELDYRWPDGQLMAVDLLEEVEDAAPDFIHIAVQTGEWERDSFYSDGNSLAGLARRITRKPVIANGGLHGLDLSRRVLQEEHADLISIGKAALADPAWPANTFAGRL